MEPISHDEFLAWAAGLGIAFDERYPDSRSLVYRPYRDCSRFWVLPGDPATWPYLLACVLDGFDEWSGGCLWPRPGRWPLALHSERWNESVRDVVLRGAGIPDGWEGAIRFTDQNADAVVAVLFVYLAFGWCWYDDLYLIPDHGRQFLQTDHHDVVHVDFAEESRISEFVDHLSKMGYSLPTEPPDWTFKRPSWMPEKVPD